MFARQTSSRAFFWLVFALTFALAVSFSLWAAGGTLTEAGELLAPIPTPTRLTLYAVADSYVDDEPSRAGFTKTG